MLRECCEPMRSPMTCGLWSSPFFLHHPAARDIRGTTIDWPWKGSPGDSGPGHRAGRA